MSTSKHIDKICIAAIAVILIITILFMSIPQTSLLWNSSSTAMGYEDLLFNTETVHSVDIVIDDWDSFIENCESEEYSQCLVLIDGEKFSNIAIRAKGNTSLSNVKSMDSQRYSLKLEFDHYVEGKSYHGLDKLCLNNLIQDNTMMKDYLAYTMMNEFSVTSPLCSYVYITVNGEDWGLYLAVESVEDSFLKRNYGSDTGDLYKPDSMSFGGGKGNGMDFRMSEFSEENMPDFSDDNVPAPPDGDAPEFPGGDMPGPPGGDAPEFPGGDMPASSDGIESSTASDDENNTEPSRKKEGFGGGMAGMGSDDVKLKYTDDDPDSYSNIFNNAKTTVTTEDKARLISSLKNLNEYKDLEDTLDIDEVLRYFVVHTYLCNGDSYTGSMVHNYYLHEEDGKLSMIPWDYNLAYGTFQGGDSTDSVNALIDDPLDGGDLDSRPMVGWIFSDETYTNQYHELYKEFVDEWYTSGRLDELIQKTYEMIRPYVEKDPTKFCTTEEFETGVTALSSFVSLRFEAVSNQLNGDFSTVDTNGLNTSDMGSMSTGGGPGGGGPGAVKDKQSSKMQGDSPDDEIN